MICPRERGSEQNEMEDLELSLGFWERYRWQLILAAISLWVAFIVSVYVRTRPVDMYGTATYTLKVGALPVT